MKRSHAKITVLSGVSLIAVCLAFCTLPSANAQNFRPIPQPAETLMNEDNEITFDDNKVADDKKGDVPAYAGIGAKSQEEIDAMLNGVASDDLLGPARKLYQERLYQDALVLYKRILHDPQTSDSICQGVMQNYVACLQQTDQFDRLEDEMKAVIKERPNSIKVVTNAIKNLDALQPDAFLVDGELTYVFTPGAKNVSLRERNRVMKLQLLRDALPLARACQDGSADEFYQLFIRTLKNNDWNGSGFWKLQVLTDIDALPELKDLSDDFSYDFGGSRNQGAPVDENGDPVFFQTPESFEKAQNDGERVQALRAEAFERTSKYGKYMTLMGRANEARDAFGVQTLARYQAFQDFLYSSTDSHDGVWSLQTLKDNETIAKLANGVKRFALPKDYDYIACWREALEYAERDSDVYAAWQNLAGEYQNRRQLDRAAECWSTLIEKIKSKNPDHYLLQHCQTALSQIVDPRIQFEAGASNVAGMNASLNFRYRNATGVEATVKELKVDELVKQFTQDDFLRKNPFRSITQRITDLIRADYLERTDDVAKVIEDLQPMKYKFVGDEVARFSQNLEPDPDHFDRTASLELPKLKPGAYLVELAAKDGNKDYVVIWLKDRVVQRSSFQDGNRFFLLDAESGAPISNADLEFIFITTKWGNRGPIVVSVKKEIKRTDESGAALIPYKEYDHNTNESTSVVTIAPSADPQAPKQYSFLDAQSVMRVSEVNETYLRLNAFFLSDRPIYRPNQKANFKFWVGTAAYDIDVEKNDWAGQKVAYVIQSPNGEKVAQKGNVELDAYGAFSDSFDIPDDAQLGVYSVMLGTSLDPNGNIQNYLGSGSFRLEEYRKPEFKVAVNAPKDPVKLGDKFKATVKADYYFGAPVSKGTVHYTVTRNTHRSTYYPARYWDWFYGPGYWQFTYDCLWYPGAYRWYCRRLPPFYSSFPYAPPEEIASGEAPLKEDGTFEIEIDSAVAKAIYPNDDHVYNITARVVDQSRREIVGVGKVYVTREPFQTYAWFDRGYYKVGDKMTAAFQARRLDGKPVVGKATVKLYKIAYAKTEDDVVKPTETEVFTKDLVADEQGCGSVDMTATEPGQYRLSCVLSSESGVAEEGGQLIMVRGDKKALNASQPRGDYRFSALEIIPEKPEYAVGDVAKIQIASNRADATVFVKLRTQNSGLGDGKPIMLQLKNGLADFEFKIEGKDQPNFFLEATTVFEGRCYDETKEIVVPPAKRILDIAVEPSKERVKPGEKAKVKLRLTDPDGEPVVGQTVVTIYDKSLDDLVGGSNIEDIREFFWKWRRSWGGASFTSSLYQESYFDVWPWITAQWTDDERARQRLRPIGLFNDSLDFSDSAGYAGRMAGGAMGGMGRGAKNQVLAMNTSAPMSAMARGAVLRKEELAEAEEADMSMAVDDAAPMMLAEAKAAAFAPAAPTPMAGDYIGAAEAAMRDGSTAFVEAKARKNLADLAYWAVDLKPNDDGVLEIEVDMPENLTTWKIAAWSVGEGLRVGSGESEIITSKDLIIRMQKPRFLTQKDEVVLSANVHNYLDSEKKVRVSLEFPKDDPENSTAELKFLNDDATSDVVVPANGEARVDWRVKAEKAGVASLLMKALTNEESDAIQDTIKIKEHGIDKQVAVSGVIPASQKSDEKSQDVREQTFTMVVPEERRPETTKLTVRFSPTLAGAIFDALPYMMEYPYGCTEQTLNKFLPLVISQKALLDAGVDLEALQTKKANLNAQELGDAQERAKRWGTKRNPLANPVFDPVEARNRVQVGVERLTSMQNPDGGWGWFYGAGCVSSARQTALIARGLKLAQECDFPVEQYTIDRGRDFLAQYEREQVVKLIRGKYWTDEQKKEPGAYRLYKETASSEDVFVYFALSELGVQPAAYSDDFVDPSAATLAGLAANDQVGLHAVMKEFIWDARASLQLYPLATYGLALAHETEQFPSTATRLEMILRVLAQYRKLDDENQTLWLDLNRVNGWYYWSWFGSEFETQAYYLRLLNNVDRAILKKVGVEKDAPMLVKYLLNNRKHATYWNSTRDTAICVEAFVEFLRDANELAPNETVDVLVDGERKMQVQYSPDALFEIDGTLEILADEIGSGEHTITLRVDGDGPLYYNAYLEYFTLEDPIEKAGLEVKVERRYYKLVKDDDATALVEGGRGQAINQRVERYNRVPLKTGDDVVSGDEIEVELIVESKNDYESLLLEEPKAAGFEALDQLSGYKYQGLPAYVEYRDDRVCFFVENLPKGRSVTTYKLRAETPGKFAALPATIYGMYAPELKGNSDEFKAGVVDKE